jgi:PAS domain S-box-containing protein
LAALVASENQFHRIFDNLQDAYFHADKTGQIILVSPSAAKIYGYNSIEEMNDLNVSYLYANPEIRKNLLYELSVNDSVEDFISQGKRKDGSTFWVSMNVQIQYDENGQFSGTVGVVRDISERMQSEEKIVQIKKRFQTMFEQAPLGITLINSLNDEILEINEKFSQIIGRSKEEIKALGWMNITHPDDLQMDIENRARMNAGEISGYEMRKRFIRTDGSAVCVNMTIACINSEDKGCPQNLCMIEDITERINNEDKIRILSSAVEQSPVSIVITDINGNIEYVK